MKTIMAHGHTPGNAFPAAPLPRKRAWAARFSDPPSWQASAAVRANRPHRANAEMAYHALDIMVSLLEAAREGRHMDVHSTCERPAPLSPGLTDGQIES